MTSRALEDSRLAELPAFRLFAAYWGSLLAIDVGKVLPISSWMAVSLVALVVAACSFGQRGLVAAGTGLIGWLFVTGFVVNDSGALLVKGPGDLGRLVLFVAIAGFSAASGRHLDAILTPTRRVAIAGRRNVVRRRRRGAPPANP